MSPLLPLRLKNPNEDNPAEHLGDVLECLGLFLGQVAAAVFELVGGADVKS
jgi:hypothetical protein